MHTQHTDGRGSLACFLEEPRSDGPFPMSLPITLPLGSSADASFSPSLSPFSRKEHRKGLGGLGSASGETVVTYFFCGEEIPYRRTMSSHSLTLGHFKEQLRKKGNYRWVWGLRWGSRLEQLAELRLPENRRLMWEHLACLAPSEQPAAVLLAKFTSLNLARCVHDLWVCARCQVQASVVCVCVCFEGVQ